MFAIHRICICLLLVGTVIQEGQSGPFDALLAFKKGIIAGIMKGHAVDILSDNNGGSHQGSLTANVQFNSESSPSHSSPARVYGQPQVHNGNVRLSGNIDLSGSGHVHSTSNNNRNMKHSGSLTGNVKYDASVTPARKITKLYSVPNMNIPYVKGSSISQANIHRSHIGLPYGSHNINLMVANSGSGTGAIINVHQRVPTTPAPKATTPVMTVMDYANVIPAVNEVDFDDTDYSVTDTIDYNTDYSDSGFMAETGVDSFDSTTASTLDYTNDYSDTSNTADSFSSSGAAAADYSDYGAFEASGAADFSASGSSDTGFDASGSADFSATGTGDNGFDVTASADFSANANTGYDSTTSSSSSGGTDYTTDYDDITDVTGNSYKVDSTGYSTSSPNPTSQQYKQYMLVNMAVMRQLSDIARLHGNNRPITIRLRTRQRSQAPKTSHSSHGSVSSSGHMHTRGGSTRGASTYEIVKAPLLYKYSDVIESPDAHKPKKENTDTRGTASFSLTATGTGFGDFNAEGNADFSASGTSSSNNGFNADGSASFSATGSTSSDYSTDYIAPESMDYSDPTTSTDYSDTATSTDYSDTATSMDYSDTATSTDYSDTDYGTNDYETTSSDYSDFSNVQPTDTYVTGNSDNFNVQGSSDFSASNSGADTGAFDAQGSADFSAFGNSQNNGDFNAQGSSDFSAFGNSQDNGGFNAEGASDFSAVSSGGQNGGFNADASASFSASSGSGFDGRSLSQLNGKAIAEKSNIQNNIQPNVMNLTREQKRQMLAARQRAMQMQRNRERLAASKLQSSPVIPRMKPRPTQPKQVTIIKANNQKATNVESSALDFLASFAEAHRQSQISASSATPITRRSSQGKTSINSSTGGGSISRAARLNQRSLSSSSGRAGRARSSNARRVNQGRSNSSGRNINTGQSSLTERQQQYMRLMNARSNRKSASSMRPTLSSLDRKENSGITRAKLKYSFRDTVPPPSMTSQG